MSLRVKRLFDLGLATLALLVLAPVLALVWIAVRLDSSGPALFSQERTGLAGKPFRVLKFRTMVVGTRVEVGKETLSTDPRITRLGHVLRRTGLDELPQLVNVLRGDMSIVGPRPLLAWENQQCTPRQAARLDVKPGMTGLSQVMGRNNIPWHERVAWDLVYVDRRTFWMDLKIICSTVPVVVLGKNAYLDLGSADAIDSYMTESVG
jgi:lipopolysaccharide/colanic/teichoic acid biosynthesis glycosyltransferase